MQSSQHLLICSQLIMKMVRLEGLLCDILWSDPDKDVIGWSESARGAG